MLFAQAPERGVRVLSHTGWLELCDIQASSSGPHVRGPNWCAGPTHPALSWRTSDTVPALLQYYEQLFFTARRVHKIAQPVVDRRGGGNRFPEPRGVEKERVGGRVWARFLSCVVTRDPSYETIPKILRCWELCGTTMPAEQKGEKIP